MRVGEALGPPWKYPALGSWGKTVAALPGGRVRGAARAQLAAPSPPGTLGCLRKVTVQRV